MAPDSSPKRTWGSSSLDWFMPAQGGKTLGVANLTNDPTVRDWASYHNTQCWSTDGRYVCFTRYASNGEIYGTGEAAEVHIVDMQTGEDRKVDNGQFPRWANHRNRLFYVRTVDGPPDGEGSEVWWFDVDADRKVLMGHGMSSLGSVSFDDQWLFGTVRSRDENVRSRSYRMHIQEDAKREYIPGLDGGAQWMANPYHDVVFLRVGNRDRFEFPFLPTRYWCDIDGKNIRNGSPFIEQCHQSWLGNGEYYLLGNSQMRGRKWDEPFPSSLHFLASVRTGDVSPCGKSGRYVVGDKPMTIADLRSGDGWSFIEDLSIICYPSNIGDDSGPYDSDAKGSPDGTKVCFVSNYDLKSGPVTFITKSADETADRVEVESTEMFPDSGEIVVYREVIGYTHKTPTSFEGLDRKRYDTSGFGFRTYSPLDEGEAVTLFEARCHPEEVWKELPLPAAGIQRSIGGLDTPLIRQKSTDLYAILVREPDRPYLCSAEGGVEIVPGENHYETCGYYLLSDGKRLNDTPLRPGETLDLPSAGEIAAVAVEWSGLESSPSNTLAADAGATARALTDAPSDFSWTQDRWTVDGEEVDLVKGLQSADAVKEVVHRYDGVIAREQYNWGALMQHLDLNADGKAIRRLFYHQGALFRREYHTAEGEHISTEYFDAEGYVNEMVLYREEDGGKAEYDHWWYDKGMPERRIGRPPARLINSEGPAMYLRCGDKFVMKDYVGKQPEEAEIAAEEWYRKPVRGQR